MGDGFFYLLKNNLLCPVNNEKRIIIAIDGYSGCGKSTLARALAKKLGYVFIDSGAMYRSITWYALSKGIITNGQINLNKLIEELNQLTISFDFANTADQANIYLNNKNLSDEIRMPAVAEMVSEVAKIKEVRDKLVTQQREIGKKGGVVMDGRDIGTVVFPDAELKLFVTASTEVRARRRYDELQAKGIVTSLEEVKKNLLERDRIDENRSVSPLKKAEDAIVIDNTNLSIDDLIAKAYDLVNDRIKQI